MGSRCILAALFLLIGSVNVRADSSAVSPARPQAKKGIVFVIGGVGGYDPLPLTAQLCFPQAGVEHEIRSYFWNHGIGMILKDLQDTRHYMRKADELAELILAEKRLQPDRPIYIVANSGGTGLALFTAERLPPATLERIVLLTAAVSPQYDLRPALRATRGEVVSYYSYLDRFILGWGTWQFGTADRFYVTSAGCTGFTIPGNLAPADQQLYKRLVQIPWQPRMLLLGHSGLHSTVHSPAFLMSEVAGWLR